MAARAPGGPQRPARRTGAAARVRLRASQQAARLRIHVRGAAHDPGADGAHGQRADRLDGQRRAAGGSLRRTQAALQLLQAALRPGYQSAHRRHPRGVDHRHGHHDGTGGEPPGGAAGELPADSPAQPRPGHGGPGASAGAGRRQRTPLRHRADAVLARGRRRRARGSARRHVPAGRRRRRRGGYAADPVRPRRGRPPCADPGPARHLGRPPPPDPSRNPHLGGAGDRVRRTARGPSHGRADWLRGQRGLSLPCLRQHRRRHRRGPVHRSRGGRRQRARGSERIRPRGRADRQRQRSGGPRRGVPPARALQLPQGAPEGHRQGHLQDGDLDHPGLSRSAGVRVGGHLPRRGGPLFHRHGGAPVGREPGGDRGRVGRPPPARLRRAERRQRRPGGGRRHPVAGRRRVPPQQSTDHPQAATLLPDRGLRRIQGVQRAGGRPAGEAGDPARFAVVQSA